MKTTMRSSAQLVRMARHCERWRWNAFGLLFAAAAVALFDEPVAVLALAIAQFGCTPHATSYAAISHGKGAAKGTGAGVPLHRSMVAAFLAADELSKRATH